MVKGTRLAEYEKCCEAILSREIMISTICVLGDHIQSLGIVRIAGRLGFRVIVFNDSRICISRFSRHCDTFSIFKTEDELLAKLMKVAGDKMDMLLLPTNDRLVKFVMDHYDHLSSKIRISTPPPDVLNICYNKKLTYKKARELDVPIPETYFPERLSDVVELSKIVEYPVIIKPAVMHTFYSKTGKKVYVCRESRELLDNYSEAAKIVGSSELVIQKLIKGKARNLYSYCSFFANSKPYGSFVAHRIRQKPMDFGISTTFAVSTVNEKIGRIARRFLKGINYFGLSEVEFMYDPDDCIYKLIEINPRTWKWHSITNKLGLNLIKMMIDSFNGHPIQRQENNKQGIGWIESITDTYVVLNEILRGNMNFRQYVQTLRIKKEFACFDRHDPLPALSYVLLLPYLFFAR